MVNEKLKAQRVCKNCGRTYDDDDQGAEGYADAPFFYYRRAECCCLFCFLVGDDVEERPETEGSGDGGSTPKA